jgi:5'-3' exonuclease
MSVDDKYRNHLLEKNEAGDIEQPDFTMGEHVALLEKSWVKLKNEIEKLKSTLFETEYKIAVKDKNPTNFRDKVDPDYKANRIVKPNYMTALVNELRWRIVDSLGGEFSVGGEADDYISFWAWARRENNEDYTVCSIDKDLFCIPGTHYVIHKDKILHLTPQESCRCFYEQLLKGDPTDNILGIPGIGEKKAKGILQFAESEIEMRQLVDEYYFMAYEEDYKDVLDMMGKLLFLQKYKGEKFKVWNKPSEGLYYDC